MLDYPPNPENPENPVKDVFIAPVLLSTVSVKKTCLTIVITTAAAITDQNVLGFINFPNMILNFDWATIREEVKQRLGAFATFCRDKSE